jgi:hypothetical protein
VTLLKMSRRRLSFRTARDVGHRRHSQDWRIVAWGLVETGSEYDGLHINLVWRQIRQGCASDEAAFDLTRAVWENRVHALHELRRDKLDEALADVPAWELEPELPYFEDKVSDGRLL